jgi:hypothetical protein
MRLWNLTYNDPGRWSEVHAISGMPLGFWASVKAGGTGSPRAELVGGSDEVAQLVGAESARTACNFERTERGAILYFRSRLEVFGAPLQRGDVSGITRVPEGAQDRVTLWCGWTDGEGTMQSGSVEMRCARATAERLETYIRKWLLD